MLASKSENGEFWFFYGSTSWEDAVTNEMSVARLTKLCQVSRINQEKGTILLYLKFDSHNYHGNQNFFHWPLNLR